MSQSVLHRTCFVVTVWNVVCADVICVLVPLILCEFFLMFDCFVLNSVCVCGWN